LDYWRFKGWISFSKDEEKSRRKLWEIASHKTIDHHSQRALHVPEDFGFRMIDAVNSIAFPHSPILQLEVLRARALIYILVSTGLRISDICSLTKNDLNAAEQNKGEFTIEMKNTGVLTHGSFFPDAIHAINTYLRARNDKYPTLLISHGRGKFNELQLPRNRPCYGNPFSYSSTYWAIKYVGHVAYGSNTKLTFLGPHAFRHWFAEFLITQGAHLEDVQHRLGQ
jgi:integrase